MLWYIAGGLYLLTSLLLIIKRIKKRRVLKELKDAESQDPFFDTFYPHF